MHRKLLATLALSVAAHAQYSTTYDPNNLPPTSEQDQAGTNQCGTANNQTSMCQNLYVNSIEDFCVWGGQTPGSLIGNVEQIVVAYCTKAGRGTRLITNGTLISAHFVETPDYIQITGTGNWGNVNIAEGDAGGELDPHGPDGLGNPHGGLVFSNAWTNGTNNLGEQIHEWTNYMSISEYCIRICKPSGPDPADYCQHIYDVVGCKWVMPGDYDDGFTSCKGDSGSPPGLYPQPDGSTSTFHQGDPATPDPHPAPSSSNCQTFSSAQLYGGATPTPTTTVSSSGHGTSTGTGSHPSNTSSTGAATVGFGIPYGLITTIIGLIGGAALVF